MAEHTKNIKTRHGSGTVDLLSEVERHLRRTGMSAARFGRAVMNDPAFVRELRCGRDPRVSTVRRVRAFIAANAKARTGEARQ